MLDIGVTKLAIVGAIALIVIGPERLPGVARTVGALLGRARSYVADVKAEVSRSMELEELKKMKDLAENAVRDVDQAVQDHADPLSGEWDKSSDLVSDHLLHEGANFPQYRHPNKKWRVKRGAVPHWYKAREGVRAKALSGAARVARYRPPTFR